ncbi:MAG TPA: hypothetical protein VNT75_10270 [Symbiobacteriaceae bacterium]|nr:hypothetical protein [Symbiobacteriaceae bacterium]
MACDPATASVLLAFAVNVLTNVVGNRVDDGVVAATRKVLDRLRHADEEKQENRDLTRALLISFVQAQESICEAILSDQDRRSRLTRDEADWLEHRLRALGDERRQVEKADADSLTPAPIVFDDVALLVAPTELRPAQREADLRRRLADLALTPVSRWTPPGYEAEVRASILERLSAFFAVQVKYVDPVRHIFTAHLMAVAHLKQNEAEAVMDEMAAVLPEIAAGIGRLETTLAEIKAELKSPVGGVSGNMPRPTPKFAGRHRELDQLARAILDSPASTIAVVHGFGGMGKTSLALEFGRRHRDAFTGGRWLLQAEGRTELLPLIADLAPLLGIPATPGETAEQRGWLVLAELQRRAAAADPTGQGGAVLLLLDNVSEAALLAEPQIARLPEERWLKLLVTTRLGQLALPARAIDFITIDRLAEAEALQVITNHQPDRQWAADELAALRELARELDGFTLAVEAVAVYLARCREIHPADYLERLRNEGLSSTDMLPQSDPGVAAQMEHREKQLSLVLGAVLERLAPPTRTALDYAAFLPPDSVPWPWLRDLVAQEHPDALRPRRGYRDPWAAVRDDLEDLRFLTPGGQPDIARMHRLTGAHLRSRLPGPEIGQKLEALSACVTGTAERFARHDPELPIRAAAVLLQIALETGHPPLAAELILQLGVLRRQVNSNSILATVRAEVPDVALAVKLADLQPPEQQLVWYLLLIWELSDQGRPEARDLLERVTALRLDGLTNAMADCVGPLLARVHGVHRPVWTTLVNRLPNQNRLTLAEGLAGHGAVEAAIETAHRLGPLKNLTKNGPGMMALWARIALACWRQQRTDLADQCWERAVACKHSPADVAALVETLAAAGRFEAAIEWLGRLPFRTEPEGVASLVRWLYTEQDPRAGFFHGLAEKLCPRFLPDVAATHVALLAIALARANHPGAEAAFARAEYLTSEVRPWHDLDRYLVLMAESGRLATVSAVLNTVSPSVATKVKLPAALLRGGLLSEAADMVKAENGRLHWTMIGGLINTCRSPAEALAIRDLLEWMLQHRKEPVAGNYLLHLDEDPLTLTALNCADQVKAGRMSKESAQTALMDACRSAWGPAPIGKILIATRALVNVAPDLAGWLAEWALELLVGTDPYLSRLGLPFVLRALTLTGKTEAAVKLLETMGDYRAENRLVVARALGRTNPEKALQLLREALPWCNARDFANIAAVLSAAGAHQAARAVLEDAEAAADAGGGLQLRLSTDLAREAAPRSEEGFWVPAHVVVALGWAEAGFFPEALATVRNKLTLERASTLVSIADLAAECGNEEVFRQAIVLAEPELSLDLALRLCLTARKAYPEASAAIGEAVARHLAR